MISIDINRMKIRDKRHKFNLFNYNENMHIQNSLYAILNYEYLNKILNFTNKFSCLNLDKTCKIFKKFMTQRYLRKG